MNKKMALWTEKYRPSTIDGYVFRDNAQKKQIQSWIDNKSIPHLLFSGSAGVGKTTLAKILINQLLFLLKREKINLEKGVNLTKAELISSEFLCLIEEYYWQKKSVKEYANLLGITPKHLSETI